MLVVLAMYVCIARLPACPPPYAVQKEFNVYVDKNGTVEDLLSEAKKEVCQYVVENFTINFSFSC